MNQYSKKLMQFKKSNDTSNDQKNTICLYDVEYRENFDLELNFFLINKIDGLGQINFNNNLFLCGSPKNTVNIGSYLIKYDPKKVSTNSTAILINSIYNHYFPTIIGFKSDYLLVIGGEENIKCECYNLQINKWKMIPDLPEERYKCNAIFDDDNDTVYLFGGYDSFTRNNRESILKLNLKSLVQWEYFIIKKSNNLLARNSFALINSTKNNIMILGGFGNNNVKLDNIIELDLVTFKINISKKKLSKSSSFIQTGGLDLNKSTYFLFDDEFQIHIISNNNYNIDLINYSGLN